MRQALSLQGSVIYGLILREIALKFRISRSGYLLSLGEPIFQYILMLSVFTAIQRKPDFGTSLALFLATGIIPFFLFMHLSARISGAVRNGGLYKRVPTINYLDQAFAKGILELLTLVLFGSLVFCTLVFFDVPAVPQAPVNLILAILAITALAFGVALFNGVLSSLFKLWASIYSIVSRSMIFFSGVFYIPATLPPQARYYLEFNPMLHGVEWFRHGVYGNYPVNSLDVPYLLGWVLGSWAMGLMLLAALKERMLK